MMAIRRTEWWEIVWRTWLTLLAYPTALMNATSRAKLTLLSYGSTGRPMIDMRGLASPLKS